MKFRMNKIGIIADTVQALKEKSLCTYDNYDPLLNSIKIDVSNIRYVLFNHLSEIEREVNEFKYLFDDIKIENVIVNKPAVIVFWSDNTKTIVKCQKGDKFDVEKGLAVAISKKVLGKDFYIIKKLIN